MRTAAVVADPAVNGIADEASLSLEDAGIRTARLSVPSGEDAKRAATVEALWTGFRGAALEPSDVVVAVGGGATLDVAGFAAATFARGVALVNLPTTVLGMVDAAVGGKTAIDHAGAKNLAGAFHPPALVVVDPSTLESLPARDVSAGLAEVVKAGLLASPILTDLVASAPLPWLIEQAVRIKAGYVSVDPRDEHARRSLNLGHTFAHAIESATGYAVRHGEAVAVGLVAAARLGARLEITEEGLEPRLVDALEGLRLPTESPVADPEPLLAAMGADKKRRSGQAVYVVPTEPGAALVEGVEPRDALECLLPTSARSRT